MTSSIEEYKPDFVEFTLVKKALEEPIGSAKLSELAKGKNNVVISTNGGYPLDQNVYQVVKGMTAVEATVIPDGVSVVVNR